MQRIKMMAYFATKFDAMMSIDINAWLLLYD